MPKRRKDPIEIERRISDCKRKIFDNNPNSLIRFMWEINKA